MACILAFWLDSRRGVNIATRGVNIAIKGVSLADPLNKRFAYLQFYSNQLSQYLYG